MNTAIMAPDNQYNISPDALEIAQTYLTCNDTKETASILGITTEKVTYYLRKPEIKRFIDTIFLEAGYMNRSKLQDIMDNLIDIKIDEMKESQMGSNKDILDIVKLQHDMRMAELKLQTEKAPAAATVNVTGTAQFGNNYDGLMGKLVKAADGN